MDEARPPGGGGAGESTPATEDQRVSILQEITLALHSTLDPSELLDRLLDSSIRYTGATTGSVILLSEDGELDIVAERGLGGEVRSEVRLQLGEGITGWVAREGVALNVPDVQKDERYVMVKEHIRSELAVPMVRGKRVMGVISVDSTRAGNFSAEDECTLGFVGTQAAQILENARAFSELKRKARRDETLLELGHVLGSALDLEELFEHVMEILSRRCHMYRGCLVLTEPEGDELSIAYGHGMTPEEIARGRYQAGEGIIGRVYKTVRPIGVEDVSREPKFLGRTGVGVDDEGQYSFLAVPLTLEGRAVGVFGIYKEFPGAEEFEADLSLLEIVAGTLSQAVKIHQEAARERRELERENEILRAELETQHRFGDIVGASDAMQAVFQTITSVAPSRATVLIRGESGTGKELIAHAIHFNSPRAGRPFVCVNCAAIPEPLLEAELFGHVKGSFTGAVADRKGKFLLADGGTIFLDEIGDMSPVLQAKILRVLQEREVDAVGAEAPVTVDVRIIAATHRDLERLVEEGAFREDLYYRLNVVPVRVPPLRERMEDVRPLAEHFLRRLRQEDESLPSKFAPAALRELLRYDWPGNVRELENVVERAAILCSGEVVGPRDIPPLGAAVRRDSAASRAPGSLEEVTARHLEKELRAAPPGEVWGRTISIVERVLIRGALEHTGGVRLRAAEVLGIHRNTLRKKIEELGI